MVVVHASTATRPGGSPLHADRAKRRGYVGGEGAVGRRERVGRERKQAVIPPRAREVIVITLAFPRGFICPVLCQNRPKMVTAAGA